MPSSRCDSQQLSFPKMQACVPQSAPPKPRPTFGRDIVPSWIRSSIPDIGQEQAQVRPYTGDQWQHGSGTFYFSKKTRSGPAQDARPRCSIPQAAHQPAVNIVSGPIDGAQERIRRPIGPNHDHQRAGHTRPRSPTRLRASACRTSPPVSSTKRKRPALSDNEESQAYDGDEATRRRQAHRREARRPETKNKDEDEQLVCPSTRPTRRRKISLPLVRSSDDTIIAKSDTEVKPVLRTSKKKARRSLHQQTVEDASPQLSGLGSLFGSPVVGVSEVNSAYVALPPVPTPAAPSSQHQREREMSLPLPLRPSSHPSLVLAHASLPRRPSPHTTSVLAAASRPVAASPAPVAVAIAAPVVALRRDYANLPRVQRTAAEETAFQQGVAEGFLWDWEV